MVNHLLPACMLGKPWFTRVSVSPRLAWRSTEDVQRHVIVATRSRQMDYVLSDPLMHVSTVV